MQWFLGKKDNHHDSYLKALKDIEHKLHNMNLITQKHTDHLDDIKCQFASINDMINMAHEKSNIKQLKKILNSIEFYLDQANKKIPSDILENQLSQIDESLKALSEKISMNEINKKLKKIDDNMKELKTRGNNYYITIDRLDVNYPKLDSLTFSLDSLDVKDLSGNLTIGTHIGMKPDKFNNKIDSTKGFNGKLD